MRSSKDLITNAALSGHDAISLPVSNLCAATRDEEAQYVAKKSSKAEGYEGRTYSEANLRI